MYLLVLNFVVVFLYDNFEKKRLLLTVGFRQMMLGRYKM